MTDFFTLDQTIKAVPGLSQSRLVTFLEADLVITTSSANGPVLRPIDLARLALLCDLADHLDLEVDGLGVVIGLIDQLHTARLHLRAMAQAIEAEPKELRSRLGTRFMGLLAV